MHQTAKHVLILGLSSVALWGSVACSPRPIPPMTVEDLMDDRVTLDGVLMKCNQNPAKARNDTDCRNARVAIERLAKNVDPAVEAKRDAEFERSREKLRVTQEKARQAEEAKSHVDPYNLPLVPVDTPPSASVPPPAS